ncbi:MAG: DUF4258 domain-containing protein [Bacteroidetes bacterium]|nr:DUF4258 domain-containing protein [Bacteroidota bacterium]
MNFVLSKHAQEQMQRRSLNYEIIEDVILDPEQIVADENNVDIKVYQSIVKENDGVFLYRVFVNAKSLPNVIVTLYRTTKIDKYYETKVR